MSNFTCSNCHATFKKFSGKCPKCQEWNTLEEVTNAAPAKIAGVKSSAVAATPSSPARLVTEIKSSDFKHKPTGIGEFDRVLGGGLIPGAALLLAGEPGVGKSTILNSLASNLSAGGKKVLIVSGEEAEEQIALRLLRISQPDSLENIYIASESELSLILGHIEEVRPDLIIIDSIQTIASSDIEGKMGSPSQITETSTILTKVAKSKNIPLILVGHVTKEGTIAGPRTIEHLVDVVLFFEGDKDSSLRLLRGIKNRYGASDEIGCFEHSESGIMEVPDPSGLLLGKRDTPVAGVTTAISLEGRRPLPLEVQSLVATSFLPVPRRAVSGLDYNRSVMIQAVVERYGKIRLSNKDIFSSTVGGIKTNEPSIDLAIALSLASGEKDVALSNGLVIIGEVTLSGEIRNTPGLNRRLQEAYRLGFTEAIVPKGDTVSGVDMKLFPVSNIVEAIKLLN